MMINNKDYEVIGTVEDSNGNTIPVLDVPMMSDDKWNELAIEHRRNNPEQYLQYALDMLNLPNLSPEWREKYQEIAQECEEIIGGRSNEI